MNLKPNIQLCSPLHAPTGSVSSALSLCKALQPHCELSIWSLPVQSSAVHEEVYHRFARCGFEVEPINAVESMPAGGHLFFHMGEYPIVIGRDADLWRPVFERASSVQFSINFNIGAIPSHPWIGEYLSAIYFQNTDMIGLWQRKTHGTPLQDVPVIVLPPPVDIEPFLEMPGPSGDFPVVGLLSGAASLAQGAVDFYFSLAKCLPHAQFWFMPTPDIIQQHFDGHPQFHLFKRDEMDVGEFIAAMDIYCFPSDVNAQTLQGTRTLVEVMAAGRPAVTVNRLGPRDRIVHGESGFVSNRLDEMAEYLTQLVENKVLRQRMGNAARERAKNWPVSKWRDAILSYTTL